MKEILTVAILGFALTSYGQSYDGDKPQNWVDLTGEKYSGSDKDLSGFKIIQPEVRCDYLTRKCAVVWDSSTGRSHPASEELNSYTIYFEVLDRKKNKILEKSYNVGKDNKVVQWGEIDLKYSTVNYWVQNLKWQPKKVVKSQGNSGLGAFTIKDVTSKKAKSVEEMNAEYMMKGKKPNKWNPPGQ